jgi:DNA modification methylase
MIELNKIYEGDCLTFLKQMPDNFIDCCVTSPPYYGLRDYGVDGQIGLEETPEQYVQKLVEIFREVKRVLKPEGTLWLNLGDSYAGSGKGIGSDHGKAVFTDNEIPKTKWRKSDKDNTRNGEWCNRNGLGYIPDLKPKDLIGIPWMVAFALRADGWYLRQDIIWHKRNPMPESVTDRCTKSHEYIFLLAKSQKYYYDYEAIQEPSVAAGELRRFNDPKKIERGMGKIPTGNESPDALPYEIKDNRNKRSVWTVNTKPYKDAHFAVYPEELIVDCIKAGCPENGTVLDPFMGAGTTGLVARKVNRNYVGIELNAEYIKIAEKRIYNEIGLFV